jgi:hypothetical protein
LTDQEYLTSRTHHQGSGGLTMTPMIIGLLAAAAIVVEIAIAYHLERRWVHAQVGRSLQ